MVILDELNALIRHPQNDIKQLSLPPQKEKSKLVMNIHSCI